MKRIFLYLLITAVCFSDLAADSGKNDALISRVNTHIQRGEPKKALKMLSERIKYAPEDIELLNKRAQVYLMLYKKKEAKNEIKKILTINREYGPVHLTCAEFQMTQGEADSALWYIDKALTLENPSNVVEALYSLKGNILMDMDEYQAAEDNLILAANRPEVSITTMRDLAAVLSENRKDREALAVLKETMLIFGERLEPLINAGFVCNRLQMYDEASDHLKKALIQDPHHPFAHANLSEAYLNLGSTELAFRHIEQSLTNDKMNAYAYKIKGDCLKAKQEPEKACKAYKRAYTLDYKGQNDEVPLIKIVNSICGNDGIVSE